MTEHREPLTVGFIGAGAMGSVMVPRLAEAGLCVCVHDRDPARTGALAALPGVEAVGSLDALREVDLVVCMLPDSDAVDAVVSGDGGLLDTLAPGRLIVDMGSSDPRRTVALAQAAEQRGIRLVDAAVSGGVRGALAGTLTVMFGGGDEDLERCRPVFEAVAQKVVPMGAVGAGHTMKAINNLVSAAGLSVACEAIEIGRRRGLDPVTMLSALNGSTGRNHATENKIEQFVLSGSFDSGFALALMLKDISLSLSLAHDEDVAATLSRACLNLWRAAADELPSGADHTQIALMSAEPQAAAPAAPEHADDDDVSPQQRYIDDMVRRRGYVLDYHKIMANHDFEVLQAANQMIQAAYLRGRSLDRLTKELIFIVSLTAMRAPKPHIISHINVALALGATPREILEAIEISLPEAGVVAFQSGVEAWAEAVDAAGLEPTVEPAGPTG